MKSRIIALCLFTIILNGCSNPNNQTADTTHQADKKFAGEESSSSLKKLEIIDSNKVTIIKLPQKIDEHSTIQNAEIINSIDYVPLETNSNCLIKSIEKSLIYGDHIYILDNFGKSILKFNLQGKFIKRIGNAGKGPTEYINPIDIFVNKIDKNLYVFDDKTSKFLVFDLDGNFIKNEKIKYRLNDAQVLNDSLYVVNTDVRTNFHLPQLTNYKLLLADIKWDPVATGVKFDAKTESGLTFSRNGLYHYNDEVNYNPTLSYNIYTVTPSGLKSKYFIDAGKMALPKGFEHKATFDEFYKKYDHLKSEYVYIDNVISESDKILTTTLRYQSRSQYLFYSKRTKKVYSSIYYKDQDNMLSILTPILGQSTPEVFYGFIDAVTFVEKRDEFLMRKKAQVNPQLTKIQQENNPIVAYYKFKDF